MNTRELTQTSPRNRQADDFGAMQAPWPRVEPDAGAAAPQGSTAGALAEELWIPRPPAADFNPSIEVKATLRLLLRRRVPIVVLTCVAMAIGCGLTFVMPPTYQSRVLLLPSGGDNNLAAVGLGQAAGLASSFGINLGAPSVAMAYPDLFKSRQIRERLLEHRFELSTGERGTLQELLRSKGDSPAARRELALALLDRRVRVGIDRDTGVLQLVVSARDPLLAQQVASAYVEELVKIEGELKAMTARTNKEFIEKRLADTEAALRVSEDNLKVFQDENPHLGSDPELQLEAARLARDTRVQEEIYLTLVRQYELSKIEESRQTRGLQVIDPPHRPLTRSSPILLKNLVLSAFLGFIAASLLVVGLDWWSAVRRQLAAPKALSRAPHPET